MTLRNEAKPQLSRTFTGVVLLPALLLLNVSHVGAQEQAKEKFSMTASNDIDSQHIALMGGSKGAEMALLSASLLPWAKAVVAIAPSDLVWESFATDRLLEAGRYGSFSYQGKSRAGQGFCHN